jgi:hypothetical protein
VTDLAQKGGSAVFLNVPFDPSYERLFIALVAALIAVRRKPRCVLEIPEQGEGRLKRLMEVMAGCAVSIHDLSRVGTPARFNMPFELGLAYAIAELRPTHSFILLERKPFRLQTTLSDLNGRDPYIHGGNVTGVITCVLSALRFQTGPDFVRVRQLDRTLSTVADRLKKQARSADIFKRSLFADLVEAGLERAAQAGLLAN